MSKQFNSLIIMDEAIVYLGGSDAVASFSPDMHEYTKAVLAVLDRHGFLDIVEKREDEDDEG